MQNDDQALIASGVRSALQQQLMQIRVDQLKIDITGDEICVSGIVPTFHAKQLVTSVTHRLYPAYFLRNQLKVDRTGSASA